MPSTFDYLLSLSVIDAALAMALQNVASPLGPPSAQTSSETAEHCVSIGFSLGIIGMVTKVLVFLRATLWWLGRSSYPPFAKNAKLEGKTWEYGNTIGVILFELTSFATGAVVLQGTYCPDEIFRHMNGLTVYFEFIVGLFSIIVAILRSLRLSRKETTAPKPLKAITIINVLLGVTGWLHWSAMGRMLFWGTPYPLPTALPATYWGVTFIILMVIIVKGWMGKITEYTGTFWNGILAIVFFGGFASAFFTELAGSIKYGTTFQIPNAEQYTGILSWVQVVTAVCGQYLASS